MAFSAFGEQFQILHFGNVQLDLFAVADAEHAGAIQFAAIAAHGENCRALDIGAVAKADGGEGVPFLIQGKKIP